MLLPEHVENVARHLPGLRRSLPSSVRIAMGLLFHGGRERGDRVFGSRAALERALDRIAFEAGEIIPAPARGALADRREGCTCALGHHLHVRSDGALFTCFKMEEKVGDLLHVGFAQALREVRARPKPASSLASCRECPLATLCGGGCRAENLQLSGDGDVPVCCRGAWRS